MNLTMRKWDFLTGSTKGHGTQVTAKPVDLLFLSAFLNKYPIFILSHLDVCISSHFSSQYDLECDFGTFGYNCVNNCSGHCLNNTSCNKQTGQCDKGCNPGYTSGDCNKGKTTDRCIYVINICFLVDNSKLCTNMCILLLYCYIWHQLLN